MSSNKKNYSIHPRSWHRVDSDYPRGARSNTAKSHRTRHKSAAHIEHDARHPKDAMSHACFNSKEA